MAKKNVASESANPYVDAKRVDDERVFKYTQTPENKNNNAPPVIKAQCTSCYKTWRLVMERGTDLEATEQLVSADGKKETRLIYRCPQGCMKRIDGRLVDAPVKEYTKPTMKTLAEHDRDSAKAPSEESNA